MTTEDIAREWRATASVGYPWRACENQAGVLGTLVRGEGGGLFVQCDRLGPRRAYMKPRRKDSDPRRARAAREKIAADLAYDLGVPVPPVTLATRAPVPAGEEERVCVSLVMYPRQWSWDQVRGLLTGGAPSSAGQLLRSALPKAAAAGLVFDTWVGQTDHNDHPHNIIFGYDPGAPHGGGYLFLDFAFALGWDGAWDAGGFRNCTTAPFPAQMVEALDRAELVSVLGKVESYPEATLVSVVDRIPETHLVRDQRATLIEGLMERRGLVRGTLQNLLGVAP